MLGKNSDNEGTALSLCLPLPCALLSKDAPYSTSVAPGYLSPRCGLESCRTRKGRCPMIVEGSDSQAGSFRPGREVLKVSGRKMDQEVVFKVACAGEIWEPGRCVVQAEGTVVHLVCGFAKRREVGFL